MGIIVGAFEPYLVAIPVEAENVKNYGRTIELNVLAWEIDPTGPLTPYTCLLYTSPSPRDS